MKNIQIIDDADNAAYDIFQCEDADFPALFPGETDIAFIEEILERLGEEAASPVFNAMWRRPVAKRDAIGIHGTIFYGLDHKKPFYPTRRESVLNASGRGWRHP